MITAAKLVSLLGLVFALKHCIKTIDGPKSKMWHAHAGSTLPIVQKILRSLKHTEDATAESASTNVYMLCDMALAVASAVVKSQQSSKAKGKQPSSASTAVPGNVPLPASFYRSLDMRTSGKPCVQVWSDLLPTFASVTACIPPKYACMILEPHTNMPAV